MSTLIMLIPLIMLLLPFAFFLVYLRVTRVFTTDTWARKLLAVGMLVAYLLSLSAYVLVVLLAL